VAGFDLTIPGWFYPTADSPAANPKAEPEKTFAAKIFRTHEFGYRRITI